MSKKIQYHTVFLETEEFGGEDFAAEGWGDAMRMIKELYEQSVKESKEDGIERKVGIRVPVGHEINEDEE
jgi:hypothetical protein